MSNNYIDADRNCDFCPRLVAYRQENVEEYPKFFNGAVPDYQSSDAIKFLIVGLAPGLRGANRTGFPFWGDTAGDKLFEQLIKYKFAQKKKNTDIPPILKNTLITNIVKCVPPKNKIKSNEADKCTVFLKNLINFHREKDLKIILCIGKDAHKYVMKYFNVKSKDYKFKHGYVHTIDNIRIYSSFHCSKMNWDRKVLTMASFDKIFHDIQNEINNKI